jgi:hypothetical protein
MDSNTLFDASKVVIGAGDWRGSDSEVPGGSVGLMAAGVQPENKPTARVIEQVSATPWMDLISEV